MCTIFGCAPLLKIVSTGCKIFQEFPTGIWILKSFGRIYLCQVNLKYPRLQHQRIWRFSYTQFLNKVLFLNVIPLYQLLRCLYLALDFRWSLTLSSHPTLTWPTRGKIGKRFWRRLLTHPRPPAILAFSFE